ncbi:MAG: carboxyl transferase domain-containing protein [Chloroflexota bacterium]
MDRMAERLKEREQAKAEARLAGGAAAAERQHGLGRLTARERVDKLLDPGSFQELDLLLTSAEDALQPGAGRTATDGVITGYGKVAGRPLFLWSQDATVLGGSIGVIHAKKIASVMEKALQARVPIVGMIDSAGERAGDFTQYPHFYSLESMCRLQTLSSGVIPQINLVMGSCTGGMALSAALADFLFLVRKTSYMHVADPPTGVSSEEFGDAWTHARTTGCYDVFAENDDDCLRKCRQLLGYLPQNNTRKPPFVDTGDSPDRREEELLELVPTEESKTFDMYRLISLVVDKGEFFELRRYWAANLIVGLARLGGRAVGILANNPRDKGGCMNLDAADKMARFVRFCDAFNIPLIWLADCPAFLPAVDEETRGLIRHGSKVIFANSQATVPQITVSIRKLYGGGGLAMPGTGLGGDLYVSWPVLARGVMGAEGAVAILYKGELAAIKDEAKRREQQKKRIAEMAHHLKLMEMEQPQDFLDPRDTRPFLIGALELLADKKVELAPRKHSNIRL